MRLRWALTSIAIRVRRDADLQRRIAPIEEAGDARELVEQAVTSSWIPASLHACADPLDPARGTHHQSGRKKCVA